MEQPGVSPMVTEPAVEIPPQAAAAIEEHGQAEEPAGEIPAQASAATEDDRQADAPVADIPPQAAAPVEEDGQAEEPAGEIPAQASAATEDDRQADEPAVQIPPQVVVAVEEDGQAEEPAGEIPAQAAAASEGDGQMDEHVGEGPTEAAASKGDDRQAEEPAAAIFPQAAAAPEGDGQVDRRADEGPTEACDTAHPATDSAPKSCDDQQGDDRLVVPPAAVGKPAMDEDGEECDSWSDDDEVPLEDDRVPQEESAQLAIASSPAAAIFAATGPLAEKAVPQVAPIVGADRSQLTLLGNFEKMPKIGVAEMSAYRDQRQAEAAGTAIDILSASRGPHGSETWKAAALWCLGNVRSGSTMLFLQSLGLRASSEEQWLEPPEASGITLELKVEGHQLRADHRWYNIECVINRAASGGSTTTWPAPRRLSQLRLDLHDRVKDELAAKYAILFTGAPFAKRGGPSGTTARLQAWMAALATAFNTGVLSPRFAVTVLLFLQMPAPEGVAPGDSALPTVVPGLCLERGESDSHLGGEITSHRSSLPDALVASPC